MAHRAKVRPARRGDLYLGSFGGTLTGSTFAGSYQGTGSFAGTYQ